MSVRVIPNQKSHFVTGCKWLYMNWAINTLIVTGVEVVKRLCPFPKIMYWCVCVHAIGLPYRLPVLVRRTLSANMQKNHTDNTCPAIQKLYIQWQRRCSNSTELWLTHGLWGSTGYYSEAVYYTTQGYPEDSIVNSQGGIPYMPKKAHVLTY